MVGAAELAGKIIGAAKFQDLGQLQI